MEGSDQGSYDEDDFLYHDASDDNDAESRRLFMSSEFMSDSDDGGDDEEDEAFFISNDLIGDGSAIERLLDLEDPVLTEPMLDHLLQGDALAEILSYVTRINPDLPKKSDSSRARDYSDLVALKRSFNAMELVSSQRVQWSMRLVQERYEQILTTIFAVLDGNSDGNFHHFRRIFENILRQKPVEVIRIVSTPDGDDKPLIYKFIEYLDESPVSSCLGTLLFLPVPRGERRPFYLSLIQWEYLRLIIERICVPDESASYAIADFLARVIDECTRADTCELITLQALPDRPTIMDWLFDNAMRTDDFMGNAQRASLMRVALCLITKSAPREYEVALPTDNGGVVTQRHVNHLNRAFDIFRKVALDRADQLREMLINNELVGVVAPPVRFSSYTIPARFPTMRLAVLELIYEVLRGAELDEIEDVLGTFDAAVWQQLTNWFFEYRFNNVYHTLFCKLFTVIIQLNHVPTLKNLLTKTKFLSRMIEHYNDEAPSGCHGYILLFCNILRLSADSQPLSEYLPSMLESHHLWQQFIEVLRSDTQAQIMFNPELEDATFQRPPPHVGPMGSGPDAAEAPLVKEFFIPDGVDLGSQYAYSLGFVGTPRDDASNFDSDTESSPEKKKKKKKKKKKGTRKSHSNGGDSSSDAFLSSSEDDEDANSSFSSVGSAFSPGPSGGLSIDDEPSSPVPTRVTAGGSGVSTPLPVKYTYPPNYSE